MRVGDEIVRRTRVHGSCYARSASNSFMILELRPDETAEEFIYEGPETCSCGQFYTMHAMVQCDRCSKWDHLRCAKLNEQQAAEADYTCLSCRESDHKTSAGKPGDDSYKIESISDYGYTANRMRGFFVIWERRSSSQEVSESFVRENDLEACSQMVHEFCDKHELRRSFLDKRFGCNTVDGFNVKNWQPVSAIMRVANWRRARMNNLSFDSDIAIVTHKQHVYIVGKIGGTCYVSDTGNQSRFPEVLVDLQNSFGHELQHLPNNILLKNDFCVAGAILIIWEFAKFIQHGTAVENFTTSNYWKDRVVKHLHKFTSKSSNSANPQTNCPKCGRNITKLGSLKRRTHMRFCK